MKLSATRIALILVAVIAPVLFFQNCSKMNFEKAPEALTISSAPDSGLLPTSNDPVTPSGDLPVGYLPNDAEDNLEDQEDLAENNPDPALVPGANPAIGENSPDMADPTFPSVDLTLPPDAGPPSAGSMPASDGEDRPDSGSGPAPGLVPITGGSNSDYVLTPSPENSTSAQDESNCAAFSAGSLNSFDYTYDSPFVLVRRARGSVKVINAQFMLALNLRGSLFVDSPLNGFVTRANFNIPSILLRIRGPVCVNANASTRGNLGLLLNQRGYAEVNNVNMRKIRNLEGKLVIRNSYVRKIIRHRGEIVLINSKVDKIRNQIGKVTLVGNSSVGRMKNVWEYRRK